MKITENQHKKYKNKTPRKTTIEPAAPVGTSSIHVLLGSRPSAFLPCLPSPSYFRPPQFCFYSSCFPSSLHSLLSGIQPLLLLPPHPPLFPWDTASPPPLPSHLSLILVPPHHERLGCFGGRSLIQCHFIVHYTTGAT